jgi:hypothetical protein
MSYCMNCMRGLWFVCRFINSNCSWYCAGNWRVDRHRWCCLSEEVSVTPSIALVCWYSMQYGVRKCPENCSVIDCL